MIEVERITHEQTKPFLLNVHYARRMPSISYAFGAFEGGVLVGCVTYGCPASHALCIGVAGEENADKVIELNRLCFLPGMNKPNYASQLVSKSLKMLPNGMIVVSYADAEGWGHIGYVYQACNFLYTGKTKSRTDKYSDGHSRHYEQDETRRQYRTAKHRYIFITGSRNDKRYLKKKLNYEIIGDYPKGDTHRYDTYEPLPVKDKFTSDKDGIEATGKNGNNRKNQMFSIQNRLF